MRNELRKLTERKHKKVIETLRGFEKRSKFIEIKRCNNIWGSLCIEVIITKENKIVDEMIDYLKNICGRIEEEGMSVWFYNYEDNNDFEDWDFQLEICVSKM